METLTVWAHDSTAAGSQEEVLVDISLLPGAVAGDIAELRTSQGRSMVFVVVPKPASSAAQISVSPGVMSVLDLAPRAHVSVKLLQGEEAKATHLDVVELHFKGLYLVRADEYRIAKLLTGQCVWTGQRVAYLDGLVRLSADLMYRGGRRVSSGYVSTETRVIFRSDSSRMLIFIQMASEMWNFDETGDIMFHRLVNSFLPEMMHRWRDQGDHHVASIILFTSIENEGHNGDGFFSNGRVRNFYRVVVDQVHVSRWSDIMQMLRKEFARFPRNVLVGEDGRLIGSILPSRRGNVLEAFELATTLLTSHFDDKDLCRATSQCLLVTPGPGTFECDLGQLYHLSKMLLSVEIGAELVCLARPPLHVTPLFLASTPAMEQQWCVPTWINVSFWSSPDRYIKQWIPRCRIYDLQTTNVVETEARGFTLRSVTPQPQTLDSNFMRRFDAGVFKSLDEIKRMRKLQIPAQRAHLRPVVVESTALPSLSETGSLVPVNAPLPRVLTGGARSVLSGLLRKRSTEGLPSTQSSSQSPQTPTSPTSLSESLDTLQLGNMKLDAPGSTLKRVSPPSRPSTPSLPHQQQESKQSQSSQQNQGRSSCEIDPMWRTLPNPAVVDHPSRLKAYGRWANVYPAGRRLNVVSWHSLKSPASLPLTTEEAPSVAQFRSEYKFQFYQVVADDGSISALVEEMIGLRLQMGFQIAVGSGIEQIEATFARGQPGRVCQFVPPEHPQGSRVYLVRYGLIHRLAIEESSIEVQLYSWMSTKLPPKIARHDKIMVQTRFDEKYHSVNIQNLISDQMAPQWNWSQLDQQLADSDDVLSGSSNQLVAIRFSLLPVSLPQPVQTTTTLNTEETRVEGITRIVNSLLRHRVDRADTGQTHEVFPVLFYTGALSKVVDSLTAETALPLQRNRLNKSIEPSELVKELRSRAGIPFRDQRWHWKVFHDVFLGYQLVAWLLNVFSDISTPEEAVEYGRQLMERGVFRHPEDRHQFRDGHYFYTLCQPYSQTENNIPERQKTEPAKDERRKSRISLSQAIRIDIDPKRLSPRKEHIQVHIDRLQNPKNAFHIQVEWLNATPRLVDDLFSGLARVAARYGLRFVQVPIGGMRRSQAISPFQSVLTARLNIDVPSEGREKRWFHHWLLRRNGYVLDMPNLNDLHNQKFDIEFSWGPLPAQDVQYVHGSGMIIAQITSNNDISLTPNTLYLSRLSYSDGGGAGASQLIQEFASLCANRDELRTLLDRALAGESPTSDSSMSTPMLSPSPSLDSAA